MNLKDILDFYSQPANFTYHNFNLYPSICGGIISLILQILLLIYLVYLIIDMSKREVPTIYESTMYEENPSPYTIYQYDNNKDFKREGGQFLLFFGVTSNGALNNSLIDNGSFKFSVQLHETTLNGEENIKNLSCSHDGKSVDSIDFVDEEKKDYYYITDEYTLKGNIDFPDSSWLEITLVKANQSLNLNDNDTEYQIQFYYQYRTLKTRKFKKKIIEDSMESLYYILLEDYIKEVDFPFSVNEIKTNDLFLPRYLVGNYKSKYYLFQNQKTEQIKEQTKESTNEKVVFKLRIHLSRESKKYIRQFGDIITILATIGGLSGIVFPIGFLLVCGISNFRMTEDMMNDRYYIMDPTKNTKIPSFYKFITDRKKKLFQKYNQRRIQNKNNKNNLENNEDDLSISNINDNNEKNQIEINDNLEDDDGLNEYDANPLEKFFTLRRIVDMYGYDINLLNNLPVNNINNQEVNEPVFDPQNINQTKYIIYKFIYDTAKYKSQPDFKFNFIEMCRYFLFNFFCNKKKKQIDKKINEGRKKHYRKINVDTSNEKVKKDLNTSNFSHSNTLNNNDDILENLDNLERKFIVYDGAKRKLGMDFDLINILKTIEGFYYFKKVFLEKHQQVLFDAVTKQVIDINTYRNKVYDNEKEEGEYEDLLIMNKIFVNIVNHTNGKILPYRERLMYIIGRSENDIKTFQNVIDGEDISDKISKDINDINKGDKSSDSIDLSYKYESSDMDRTSDNKDKSEHNISILDKKNNGVKKENEETLIENIDNGNDEQKFADELQKNFGNSINSSNDDDI